MKKTTEQLDTLLSDGLVKAPDDFSNQLVQKIAASKQMTANGLPSTSRNVDTPLWQWIALGTAGVAGLGQLVGFIFGVWVATAAG